MKKLFLILVAIGFSITTYAQQTVSGTVLEEGTDIPLLGVSVLVKGTSSGASTDFDGNYSISDVDNDATLVFSYLGYKPRKF